MDSSFHDLCPLRLTMDIIGGKWKLNIICLLRDGKPLRYNAIKRAVPGITNVMLAQSLKNLEGYGILSRQQYNEVPIRVEYQLSDAGMELLDVLRQFRDWGTSICRIFPTWKAIAHSVCCGKDGL